jgi:hypothetical protein
MSQGNSLCSYLKQAKCHFLNIFLLQNWRTGGQSMACLGNWYQCSEDVGKGGRSVNMVQILCTHVCKWKNETC